MDLPEHGHSEREIAERLANPPGRGDLRDAVYGAIDGAVTTFAIVAGVAGAGLSPFVIVGAGACQRAGGRVFDGGRQLFSHQGGARQQAAAARRGGTAYPALPGWRAARSCARSCGQKGLSGVTLDEAVEQIARNRNNWIETMLEGEYGIGSVDPHPLRAALVTFAAFLVAGAVPLVPFLIGLAHGFTVASVLTLITFFAIGSLKSVWSLAPWWRSGLETLAIGGVAAGIAYWVGSLFG